MGCRCESIDLSWICSAAGLRLGAKFDAVAGIRLELARKLFKSQEQVVLVRTSESGGERFCAAA